MDLISYLFLIIYKVWEAIQEILGAVGRIGGRASAESDVCLEDLGGW